MESIGRRQFVVGACLGRGGFGEVYRATMLQASGLRSEVAVKVLRADLDPKGQAVARLRDEGRLLSRLDHPVILRVLDLVELEGRIGLVTELVEGEDLGHVAQRRGAMPLRPLLDVSAGVAEALDAAWSTELPEGGRMEIVHRDVKPSNIRISRHGQVKLLDFGIARTSAVEREAHTGTDLLIGSPGYMAPERFLEPEVHPASDVFGLGVSLYEALAGERFYEGLSIVQMSAFALDPERHAALVESRLHALEVPAGVHELLESMLCADPYARSTAAVVARRSRELADDVGGPDLVRWARDRSWVDPPTEVGALQGRTLTEGALPATHPAAEPPVRPPTDQLALPVVREGTTVAQGSTEVAAERSGLLGLAAGGVAFVVVVVLGVGVVLAGAAVAVALLLGGRGGLVSPEDAVALPTLPEPEEVPLDATSRAEPPAPDPRAPAPVATDPVVDSPPVAPGPVVTTSPEVAEPEVPPPSGPLATVHTQRSIPVRLFGTQGVVQLGPAPAGSYTIQARFGERWVDAGSITVGDRGRWRIDCTRMRETCEAIPD